MENQYCKVGATTPISHGRQTIALLEYQYQKFMDRASSDANLSEYFENKANKIQKILKNLA